MRNNNRSEWPKIGIALSGGSARGIAHIGVLQALIDHKIPISCIAGTSAGAIVATAFAFKVPMEKLQEKAKSLSWYSLPNFPTSALGLASNQSVKNIMEQFIGDADFSEAKIPLAIVATNIETGEKVVYSKGSVSLAVRASACIPGLFVPVEIDGLKMVDGGLSESLPLSPLQNMDADIKIGVNVIHWHSVRKVTNILDVLSNSVDIVAEHQKENPLDYADVIIEPNLSNFGASDFKKTDAIVAEGYRAATLKIPEIKKLIEERKRSLSADQAGAKPKTFLAKIRRWFRHP